MNEINEAGLSLVKSFEGLYLKAYQCAAGVWTIGWGHTGRVDGKQIKRGMTITKSKAEKLLAADMAEFWAAANSKTYVPIVDELNDNQRSALCSFAFNCGEGNLKRLCAGRSAAEIAEAMLRYNKAAGRELAGLTRRRKAERALFLSEGVKHDMDTLKKGDKGQQVQALQKLLNVGAGETVLAVDGKMGALTCEALQAYQTEHGLTADGICGAKTWEKILK